MPASNFTAGAKVERVEAIAEITPNVEHGHTMDEVLATIRSEGFEPLEIADGKVKIVLASGDQCSNCRFWLLRGETPQTWGFCRRQPPVLIEPQKVAVYPITLDTLWCGEYQPRAPRPAQD